MKSLVVVGLTVLSLSACSPQSGAPQFLKSTNVAINQQGTDSYVSFSASVNLGNAKFDNVTVGVNDPKTNVQVGSVMFSETTDSTGAAAGLITLSVNASLITHADASIGNTLPNNSPLPLALAVQPGEVLAVPFLTHSRVYLGGDLKNKIIAGVAIGIKGLDSVMSQVGFPADIFYMLQFTKNIMGVGGIYGAPAVGENGIAVFGKFILNPAPQVNLESVTQAQNKDFSDFYKLNNTTKNRLINFFSDEEQVLEIH